MFGKGFRKIHDFRQNAIEKVFTEIAIICREIFEKINLEKSHNNVALEKCLESNTSTSKKIQKKYDSRTGEIEKL